MESKNTRHVSLLIDGVLAIEAGSITSSLTLSEQQKLKAILISHQHYDHIRDLPAIGINFSMFKNTITVYSTGPVYEVMTAHLLNNKLYPNYLERPPDKPAIRFEKVEAGKKREIDKYTVLPVTVNHGVPTVGYQITSSDGKVMLYTSDTGPGLADCWKQVSPELVFIELTAPDRYQEYALHSGHLTPAMLRQELESFQKLKGYLPRVILLHMHPMEEKEIESEISLVSLSLNARIERGYEGMLVEI